MNNGRHVYSLPLPVWKCILLTRVKTGRAEYRFLRNILVAKCSACRFAYFAYFAAKLAPPMVTQKLDACTKHRTSEKSKPSLPVKWDYSGCIICALVYVGRERNGEGRIWVLIGVGISSKKRKYFQGICWGTFWEYFAHSCVEWRWGIWGSGVGCRGSPRPRHSLRSPGLPHSADAPESGFSHTRTHSHTLTQVHKCGTHTSITLVTSEDSHTSAHFREVNAQYPARPINQLTIWQFHW